jgi:multiple antibiotic resistance protein
MADVIDLRFLGSVLVTLFVIMDPPGVLPVFLGLVGRKPAAIRSKFARQATFTSLGVIVLFAVLGEQVLSYLKISLPSLQGAGGLLLLLVSLQLLTGNQQEHSKVEDVNVALVPLGTPLLAGPGAIVATILFARQANGTSQYVALAAGIIAVHITIWVFMRFSSTLARLLRPSGIILVTRIAGLLVAAIGVQLVADSVAGFIAAG